MPRYVPNRGDFVELDFDPAYGHEQQGARPALVLTPVSYNEKTDLAVVCAITNQVKGYPFEVIIPQGARVTGAVLVDQVRTVDWRSRRARFLAKCPAPTLTDVGAKMRALLNL